MSVLSVAASRTYTEVPGLIAHWPLSAGSGSTANDISGFNRTGTIYNATWVEQGVLGRYCLSFNGTDAYINFGDFFYSDTLTIATSFKLNSGLTASAIRQIAVKRNIGLIGQGGTNLELAFGIDANYKITLLTWKADGNVSMDISGSTTISTDSWHRAVVSYAGSGALAKIYVDGIQEAEGTPLGPITNSTSDFQIGAMSAGLNNRWWSGLIENFKIYNRAVTPTEVAFI